MNRNEIFEKLLVVVTPFCKNQDAVASISEDSRLLQDLNINSARLVDIVLSIEDEFNIEVDDASADSIRTMGDAVNVIAAACN